MGVAELKLDIFRMVDQLPESELQKLYGMITHLADPDAIPWNTLSDDEKAAIEKGLAQLDQGQVKPHAEVMAKFRKGYHL
jgi:predicted transcriptional regulator